MNPTKALLAIALACVPVCAHTETAMSGTRYPLVPWPAHLVAAEGTFALAPTVQITLSDPTSAELKEIGAGFQEAVQLARGPHLVISDHKSSGGKKDTVAFVLDKTSKAGPEGYALTVTPQHVTVVAPTAKGVFYGAQTLAQLL